MTVPLPWWRRLYLRVRYGVTVERWPFGGEASYLVKAHRNLSEQDMTRLNAALTKGTHP